MAASKQNAELIHLFYSGTRGGREGWATRAIKGLEVDTPVLVSDVAPQGTQVESARTAISAASKRLDIKVATRTVDGNLYMMRLRDADPAQPPTE